MKRRKEGRFKKTWLPHLSDCSIQTPPVCTERMKKLYFLWTVVIEALQVYKGVRYAEPQERWTPPVKYAAGFDHAIENRQAGDNLQVPNTHKLEHFLSRF